jgi:hypothetical protein
LSKKTPAALADADAETPLLAYAKTLPMIRLYWSEVFARPLRSTPALVLPDLRGPAWFARLWPAPASRSYPTIFADRNLRMAPHTAARTAVDAGQRHHVGVEKRPPACAERRAGHAPQSPAGARLAPGTGRGRRFQGVRVSLTSSEAVRDEIDKRSELRRGAAIRQIDDMRGLRGQRIIAQDGRKEPGLDVIGQ